jgi:UDP-N-acetylmuramate--alanine ligase
LYPNRTIKAIFQPHLFSRTADFAQGFSEALSLADEVILLPIYPARELPREGVNSQMLIPAISKPVRLVEKENLLQNIHPKAGDVWVTLGAGDIDALVQPLKNAFFEHYKQL